jgi:hypothetical protein
VTYLFIKPCKLLGEAVPDASARPLHATACMVPATLSSLIAMMSAYLNGQKAKGSLGTSKLVYIDEPLDIVVNSCLSMSVKL